MNNVGRPKGAENIVNHVDWHILCKDLRNEPEFRVPMDDSQIEYIKDGFYSIVICKDSENEDTYSLFVNINYDGKIIDTFPCQTLKNQNELYYFVNRLMSDDWEWDWTAVGKIKQFKTSR